MRFSRVADISDAMLKRPSNRALVNPLLVEPIRSDDIGSTSTASVPRHIRLTVPLEWTPGSQLLVKLDGDKRLSVAVPPDTAPGSFITVAIGEQRHRVGVTLPADVQPGQHIAAKAPDGRTVLFQAPADAHAGQRVSVLLPTGADEEPASAPPPDLVNVRVPNDFQPGQRISVQLPNGDKLTVDVPAGTLPGALLRVSVPPPPPTPTQPMKIRFIVPEGEAPGSSVTVAGPGGRKFSVKLPENAYPGAEIEINVGGGGSTAPPPEAAPKPAAAASDEAVPVYDDLTPVGGASGSSTRKTGTRNSAALDRARAAAEAAMRAIQLSHDSAAALAAGSHLVGAEWDETPQSDLAQGLVYEDLRMVAAARETESQKAPLLESDTYI